MTFAPEGDPGLPAGQMAVIVAGYGALAGAVGLWLFGQIAQEFAR